MKRVNKNFIYNILYQFLLYIVPLILVPYISRVLGPEKIGTYSYTYSIVYYFMLFTMLGINNYGSRSVARLSNDKEKMSEVFFSIYGLQWRIGVVMLLLYNIVVIVFLKNYIFIALIHNLFLVSAILDVNWFYFGIEKFKFTVTRNAIIKVLSLILVFIFVKKEDDLWIYTLIMAASTLISQLYIFVFLRKYVKKVKVSYKKALGHLKSCLILFIPVVAYGIYRVMDKTMLGYIASTVELGYYENAEKIINIPISILTAMGTVMMPYMAKSKDLSVSSIKNKIYSSFELCFFCMIPMMLGLYAINNDFVKIFFGNDFLKCIDIIVLLIPTILFASIANVIRTNYLIPFEKDNIYVKSTIYGAIINLILNMIFIKPFGAIGACIGTLAAEFSVMFYQLINVRKEIQIINIMYLLVKYLIKGIIMYIIIVIIGSLIDNIYIRIITQLVFGVTIYFILCKNYIIYDFLGLKRKKI